MSIPAELKPTAAHRVMDLVANAGLDVSSWADFAGGAERAASNPKFCYEWAFIERGNRLVLSLWHSQLQIRDGTVFQEIDPREWARRRREEKPNTTVAARALRMDAAIRVALEEGLPVRVIICDGRMSDEADPERKPAQVNRRLLDAHPWAITAYDWKSGMCTLTRDAQPVRCVDQFTVAEGSTDAPRRREAIVSSFQRDHEVRRRALGRAVGSCEFCRSEGFLMADGRRYLETHHLTPLALGGPDSDENVVALCANCHREAHYGMRATEITESLRKRCVDVHSALEAIQDLRPQ